MTVWFQVAALGMWEGDNRCRDRKRKVPRLRSCSLALAVAALGMTGWFCVAVLGMTGWVLSGCPRDDKEC